MLRVAVLGPVRAWSGGEPLPLGSKRQRHGLRGAGGRGQPGRHPPRTDRRRLGPDAAGHRAWQPLHLHLGPAPQPGAGRSPRIHAGRLHVAPRRRRAGRGPLYRAVRGRRRRAAGRGFALVAGGRRMRAWAGSCSTWNGPTWPGGGSTRPCAGPVCCWIRATTAWSPSCPSLVRDHPLHEPLYELLMTALQQAGRAAEALEVFRDRARDSRPGAGSRARPRVAGRAPPDPGRPDRTRRVPAGRRDHARGRRAAGGRRPCWARSSGWEALVAVSGRAPLEVIAELDEALADGVLIEAGDGLAFREPGRAAELRDNFPGRAPGAAADRRGCWPGSGFPRPRWLSS